jgi:hypothetical protein
MSMMCRIQPMIPSDGERKKSRDSDGFHLSLVGNKILAAAINSEIDAALERRATQ